MNSTLVHWHPEPQFRGTFTILTSCLSTLILCVWTAIHVDIQLGKSYFRRFTDKIGWLIVGLLAPELLLLIASNQLFRAYGLYRDAQKWLYTSSYGESIDDDKASHASTVRRKHPWTLTHSFFAVMGGFVLEDPHSEPVDRYLPHWQRSGVLTRSGVRFLMQHEPSLIPDLPLASIVDRSKADGIAKALLIWQVLWFCLSCLNRVVQGLPLCLLEVSTIAHAVCALLTCAIWWNKPKDVGDPVVIVGKNSRELGAWMTMTTHPVRFAIGGIFAFTCPSEQWYLDNPDGDDYSKIQKGPWDALTDLYQTWKARYVFRTDDLPSYRISSMIDRDDEATTLRRALAAEASERYPGLAPDSDDDEPFYVSPVAQLQRFTLAFPIDNHILTEDVSVMLFFPVIAMLTAAYGLPHLIGWNAVFSSAFEQKLWRVATIVVMALGATFDVLLLATATIAALFDEYDVDGIVEVALIILGVVCVTAYACSSMYLVAESFRQLFALPTDAFVLPSWANYWPHFS